MPGQTSALKEITKQLQARNVHVLWPVHEYRMLMLNGSQYNPWDTGTRRTGDSDEVSLDQLIVSTGGEGFNGDTMGFIPESFYTVCPRLKTRCSPQQESLKLGKPLALEPEGGGNEDAINWATLGWGYWDYKFIPGVDRWKWLASPRITHCCDRWNKNKTDNLQYAFFNGDG